MPACAKYFIKIFICFEFIFIPLKKSGYAGFN
jgi:hypothetical protein